MRAIRSIFHPLLVALYVTPVREVFISLKGLPPGMRILGILGYTCLAAALIVMVVSAIPGVDLGAVTFPGFGEAGEITVAIPRLIIITGLLGLLLSWVYILTGATKGKPLVFLPLVGLFSLMLVCLMPLGAQAGSLWLIWFCTIPPVIIAASAMHLFTYKKAFWRDFPLLEFLFWLVVLALAGVLFWLGRSGISELTSTLDSIFLLLFLLLLPVWLLLGISAVDLAVKVARWVITRLRRLFSQNIIQALAVFVLTARPAMLPLLFLADQLYEPGVLNFTLQESPLGAAIFFDALLSIPLLIALLITFLARRWDGYRAAKLLAFSLATPVFLLGFMLGVSGGPDILNPFEFTVKNVGLLPSVAVFVILLIHSVLGLGEKFSRVDGKVLPRHGRILLVFGLALLVVSLAVFVFNLSEAGTGYMLGDWEGQFTRVFLLGLIVLGLPYLLWITWRRSQRLAGSREDYEAIMPRFTALSFTSNRKWILMAVLTAMMTIIFACLIALLFAP